MKKYNFRFFAILLMSVIFISCDKEETITTETTVEDKGYVVENGTIKFRSYSDYDDLDIKLSKMSLSEINSWRSTLSILSLYDSYFIQGISVDTLRDETRVADKIFSMLLNKDGILIVGDTIVKIIDEFGYKIHIQDSLKLKTLQDNPLTWEDLEITRFKHSNYFVEINEDKIEQSSMQKFKGTKNIDGEVYEFEDGKREEKVILSAFSTNPLNPNGYSKIGASITGKGRKKILWGLTWGPWFNDEIYSGKIIVNSGQYTSAGVTFNLNPFSYILPAYVTYDDVFIYVLYTNADIAYMNVTYVYQKNIESDKITKTINWQ